MFERAGKANTFKQSASIQLKPSSISANEQPGATAGLKHNSEEQFGGLPTSWRLYELQQLCRHPITYGIVQCGPHVRGGIPYVRVSDMDGPELDVERMLRTSPMIAARFSRSAVEEGDLVYALRGKLGEVRQVRGAVAGANLTQGTARLAPNERVASGYLLWAMRDARSVRQAEMQAKGTTFREITLAELRRIQILVPPVPEQRAIAAALSDVDALIGALDRLIAKKRDLKQAAMQQLLTGQTRLPGFHGEWKMNSLAAACTMKSGEGITSTDIDQSLRYPCYGGNGLRGFTSRHTHEGSYALIGRQGALCGNVFGVEGRFFASEHAIVVTPSGTTDIRWLTYVLRRMNLNQYSESSAQPGLSVSKILDLRISRPPTKDEQTAIAAVLSDMDAEIIALEQRRDKTRLLKQGMMQELLTGRTRLV
jgi:type I restriction enzyme S subunit